MKPKKSIIKLKYVVVILVIITILVIVFILRQKISDYFVNKDSKNTVNVLEKDVIVKSKTTRFIAAGDFIAHDALNLQAKNDEGQYNYYQFMDQMKPVMSSADIRFCNQSTLVGGEKFGVTGYPSFNAPEAFANNMVDVGCNLINTASNHSSDKNQSVIDSNVALWQKIQGTLTVVGQNSSDEARQRVNYFVIDGLKYAFLAYTTYSNSTPPASYSVNMYSREFAKLQVAAAKAAGAKFIIVSMRWGTEYSEGVNGYQLSESQYLADLGVKLVLGHGPHVLEPVKRLTGTGGNETLVWYSLGNFLHAQLEPETLFNGIAVLEIDPKNASIISAGFLPTYMHYDWTAEEAKKQDLLARKNFELVPLEKATELFKSSHLNTTIDAQEKRISSTLNMFTSIPILNLKDIGL